MKLPQSWAAALGVDFRGRVRFARRFSRPTNLDTNERVWLVCEGVDHRGILTLNGTQLGSQEGYAVAAEFDVTELLEPRNELAVEVECPTDPHGQLLRPGRETMAGGLLGDVRLEVRRRTFVDFLQVSADVDGGEPKLTVAGTVTETQPAGELALVVTALRRELLYETVAPGLPFQFSTPVSGLPAWAPGQGTTFTLENQVEVQLISRGVAVWQVTRQTAASALQWRDGELWVDSKAAEVPAEVTNFPDEPPTPELFRRVLGTPPRHLIRSRRILPPEYYQAFDLAGIGVVQEVPHAWWGAVCPRLAHHPCVALCES